MLVLGSVLKTLDQRDTSRVWLCSPTRDLTQLYKNVQNYILLLRYESTLFLYLC
jgi:hypothetical protein